MSGRIPDSFLCRSCGHLNTPILDDSLELYNNYAPDGWLLACAACSHKQKALVFREAMVERVQRNVNEVAARESIKLQERERSRARSSRAMPWEVMDYSQASDGGSN